MIVGTIMKYCEIKKINFMLFSNLKSELNVKICLTDSVLKIIGYFGVTL